MEGKESSGGAWSDRPGEPLTACANVGGAGEKTMAVGTVVRCAVVGDASKES